MALQTSIILPFFEPVHKSNKFCNFALAMNTQTNFRRLRTAAGDEETGG